MPKYAMAFAGMAESDALKTISYYTVAGIVGLRVYFCRIAEKWFALSGPCFQCRAGDTFTAAA